MLRLLTTSNCVWAGGNKQLAQAALESGEQYELDVVLFNTTETQKAAALGLGLPVLVRSDGAMSKDVKTWKGAERKTEEDGANTIKGISGRISAEHQDKPDEPRRHDDGRNQKASPVRKSRSVS